MALHSLAQSRLGHVTLDNLILFSLPPFPHRSNGNEIVPASGVSAGVPSVVIHRGLGQHQRPRSVSVISIIAFIPFLHPCPMDALAFGSRPIFWKWHWLEIPTGAWARLGREDSVQQVPQLLDGSGD